MLCTMSKDQQSFFERIVNIKSQFIGNIVNISLNIIQQIVNYNQYSQMSLPKMPAYFYQGQKILSGQPSLGQVWLSGYHFASDIQKLKRNNIVAVVSALNLDIVYPSGISHYKLELKDNQQEEIRYTFFPVYRFIEEMRKKGGVLIHCAAGISRSVALLSSYMINKYQTSFQKCLIHIKSKRECASPNDGFRIQLKKFQSDLGIKDVLTHNFN